MGRNSTPTNISDGFYYIPFLQSLEALLNKPSIFEQVIYQGPLSNFYTNRCVWQVISGSHRSPDDLMRDVCDGTIFETNPILHNNDCALQIIGYYHELTLTNPLMSRAKQYNNFQYFKFWRV